MVMKLNHLRYNFKNLASSKMKQQLCYKCARKQESVHMKR